MPGTQVPGLISATLAASETVSNTSRLFEPQHPVPATGNCTMVRQLAPPVA